MKGRYAEYHRNLFAWHCEQFYRFDKHLTRAEQSYAEQCFDLAEGYVEPTPTGYGQLSTYSYSHRIDGEQVDSSRFAVGTLAHPEEAWEAAKPVLRERGIEGQGGRPRGASFYGLGWGLQTGDFKVYFWVPDVNVLPSKLAELARPHVTGVRPEGLVSFTFRDGKSVEEKVYLYPTTQTDLGHQTLMITTERGVVGQHDVDEDHEDEWLERLSPKARSIVDRYDEVGESLDTIAWQGTDQCTLYFP